MKQLDRKWHVMNKDSDETPEFILTATDAATLARQTILQPCICHSNITDQQWNETALYVMNLVVHHRDPCEH